MEATPADDSRWEEIMAIQGDPENNLVLLPEFTSRVDAKPRQASPKTVRFAEALAFDDAWAGITEVQRRNPNPYRRAA